MARVAKVELLTRRSMTTAHATRQEICRCYPFLPAFPFTNFRSYERLPSVAWSKVILHSITCGSQVRRPILMPPLKLHCHTASRIVRFVGCCFLAALAVSLFWSRGSQARREISPVQTPD